MFYKLIVSGQTPDISIPLVPIHRAQHALLAAGLTSEVHATGNGAVISGAALAQEALNSIFGIDNDVAPHTPLVFPEGIKGWTLSLLGHGAPSPLFPQIMMTVANELTMATTMVDCSLFISN